MVCGSIDNSDSLILKPQSDFEYKKLIFVPHEVNKTSVKKLKK